MSGFVQKQLEKTAEARAKKAIDKEMGANEGDLDDNEENEEKDGRGRKFLRKLSQPFRRDRSSSTGSSGSRESSPIGQRIKKLFKRKPSKRKSAKNESKNDEKRAEQEAGTNSDFVQTDTPVNSGNSSSNEQDDNNSDDSKNSRDGSDWQLESTDADQSDVDRQKKRDGEKKDEQRLLEMRPDDAIAYNPQAKTQFMVRVRIIEAMELQGDNVHPLVRVNLNDKTRTTRSIRDTANPFWNQTLTFNMRTSIEELAMLNCEFNVYSARRVIRDSLIGTFSMNMGIVYKSNNQAIVEKWLALVPGQQEDEYGLSSGSEIRGFLKISISVCHQHQIPPSLFARGNRGDGDEDVLYKAQLLNYCLRFRVFKLCQLADHIRYPYRKTPAAPGQLALEISVGSYRTMTSFMEAKDETLYLCEEVQIPIMWPTVIKQIRFRLIVVNVRKRKRVLCTEFLSLRQLCQPGERGFLPNFGPSFVSFYGPENKSGLWKRWERNQIRDGKQQGTHYCGRVHLEILCEESTIQKTHVVDIPSSMIQNSEAFHQQEHYTLFCNFFAANLIHPDFKSKDVHFAVSIGEFGNMDYEKVLTCTNRTLPVMPAYDTTFAYAMPWGNQKPICEILCDWENIEWRLETTNILLKIAELMTTYQEEAVMKSASNPEQSELKKLVGEAMEEAADCFESLRKILVCVVKGTTTSLDILLKKTRLNALDKLHDDFGEFKRSKVHPNDMGKSVIRQLGIFAHQFRELASDPQLSIPDFVVHMIVDGNVVGQTRIPANEVYFGSSGIRCGQNCGRIRAIPLSWPTDQVSKFRGHELPCVIHIKAWFGKSNTRSAWLQQIKPGVLNYYAELFYNEKRSTFSSNWEETKKKPFTISDETGQIELSESAITPPAGWKFNSEWKAMRSHDMWVGTDAGHTTFEDEFFEVQKKDAVTQDWAKHSFTDYYGRLLDSKDVSKAQPGWKYISKWAIDLHCIGDADGWQYSTDEKFWSEDLSTVDSVERQNHVFRRRRYKRLRRFAKNDISASDMFEDIRVFAKYLNEEGWEYASKYGEPVHVMQQAGDHFRRRRMVRELIPLSGDNYKLEMGVQPNKTSESSESTIIELQTLSPRIYEVHDQVSVFQLRVYVLWARELRSSKKHISRAYVRVFYLNRCQQTCVVENSMNPIWNETLVFNRLLVPGGIFALHNNSPSAVIECHGEEVNGKHVFLGRFDVQPSVISAPSDARKKPNWFPLRFSNNKTKGAILMHIELFQDDPTTKAIVPSMPALKQKTERYEVPLDVRPKFAQFTVQFMAWGVRNLSRFQLFAVRSPFVEISVADRRDITDTIQDTKINPNFERPLLTFADVSMPIQLSYAPPIVLNLHDKRSFGRKPLIGSCLIKNFQRYMHAPPPKNDAKRIEADWEIFDSELVLESKLQNNETKELRLKEPEEYDAFPEDPNSPKIDWWSKYYYSKDDKEKAPGYQELGLDCFKIYDCPLEIAGDYNDFADFLDTFVFLKPNNDSLDGDPNVEKRGELKGKLFITPQDKKEVIPFVPSGVEFAGSVQCLVRIYIVRGFSLLSRRRSGQCDPYITLRCGNKKKFKGQKYYIPDTLSPIFGQCIEMDITIPQEKELMISVMDRRLLLSDDEIGSTTIDLENRLLTKYRATVGLPKQYNVIGPMPWRDQLNPLQTLRRYCAKMNLPPPKILRSEKDIGIEMLGIPFLLSEIEKKPSINENFAGRPIQRVALHILHNIGLVPEHVETRVLYNSVNPDMECGKLEMFVDIFPKVISDRIPPIIDISPRQPQSFQLRVAVFGLRNVILQKKSMGRPAADLYVRCYLNGMPKSERTDIHYRCLDGAASFNWRFVFDFDYDVFERQIQAIKSKRLFRKTSTELVDPVLVIEIWDNNKFQKDKYIGQCLMNLLEFEEGQIDEDEMENVKYAKEPPLKTCCAVCIRSSCLCWRTRCCTKKQRKKDLVEMPRAPRYIPGKVGQLSLFNQRFAAGWWPCLSNVLPKKQKSDNKKNDQVQEDDASLGEQAEYVTGMVELELQLLPLETALNDPVGKKRKKPNHSPYLPKPDRPKMDSFWCTSRLKAGSRICWNKCGGWSVLWIVILVVLLILFIAAMIWKAPDVLAKKYLS